MEDMLKKEDFENNNIVDMNVLYFVTGNQGKYREVAELAKKYGLVVEMLNIEKIEIQSDDIREIALFSARWVAAKIRRKIPIVVEDAGLFIEALNGFPGPYSSYVYKTLGLNGILKLLDGIENRRAYFRAVAVLEHPVLGEQVFEGIVYGRIAHYPRGTGGFGFDPIFVPEGEEKTFAELSVSDKNKYSHRARAFRNLFEWIRSRFSKA